MKQGASLNPHAAPYVPLSKREADDNTYLTGKYAQTDNKTASYGNAQHITQEQHHMDHSAPACENVPTSGKRHSDSGSFGSSSESVIGSTDKQMSDEDFDIDLEYLRMTFPGISYQSLSDVYMVNGGDLDASIDMLSQLEMDIVESSGSLPETLDIGDVSESGSAADFASLKLKNVAAEASTSSPSSLESTKA